MAEVIKTNGEREQVTPKSAKRKFTLEELQAYVGGYMRPIFLPKKQVMVVNEEGRIKGLPINSVATEVLASLGGDQALALCGGFLVGDVVLIEKGEM